jgi:NADH dehydrogenase [ubiquinone] 1 alpha subcomplex assembly factor 5
MIQADIFSRNVRRRFRDRAFSSDAADRWLIQFMAQELIERVSIINRRFGRVLIIGNDGGTLRQSLAASGAMVVIADTSFTGACGTCAVQCDEDRLPFANGSFDLVLAPGGLDSVNDLPGALILIRRILQPDGLFLGAMSGAGSLSTLREVIARANSAEKVIARHHPQIDVRAAGDLLARAGFAQPVAESESLTVRYPDLFRLMADLRANAMTNALIQRQPLRRDELQRMAALFSTRGIPKTEESFSFIFMTGWVSPRLA